MQEGLEITKDLYQQPNFPFVLMSNRDFYCRNYINLNIKPSDKAKCKLIEYGFSLFKKLFPAVVFADVKYQNTATNSKETVDKSMNHSLDNIKFVSPPFQFLATFYAGLLPDSMEMIKLEVFDTN